MTSYLGTHSVRLAHTLQLITNLSLSANSPVLEIGCYPPEALFYPLQKLGFSVFGLCSPHEPTTLPQVSQANLDTGTLPWPDSTFSLITCCEVIEHLTTNPQTYLLEFFRLLRPGGFLLLSTPNAYHLKNLFHLGFNNAPKPSDTVDYHRHNHEFTLSELANHLSQVGFAVTHQELFSVYTPFRKKDPPEILPIWLIKFVGYYLTQLLPPLRDTIFILATKP